jgi:hypothetical protein
MSKYTFTAPGVQKDDHGARYDDNFRPPRDSDRHGAKFDEFNRRPVNPHGPQSDEGYGRKADDEFERTLAAVPSRVRNFPAGCPSCGHHHTVVDALRAGRATGKRDSDAIDVRKSVREADDVFLRDGAGRPDGLHAALVAGIEKTYGIPGAATVAKTTSRGRRTPGTFDEALAKVRELAGSIKT